MFSLCDLMSDLSNQNFWGSNQTSRVRFHDKVEGKKVGVLTESQISDMFRMYQKERRNILLLVVVCDMDQSSKCSGIDPTVPCTDPFHGATFDFLSLATGIPLLLSRPG
jgi:hypothetical protein